MNKFPDFKLVTASVYKLLVTENLFFLFVNVKMLYCVVRNLVVKFVIG